MHNDIQKIIAKQQHFFHTEKTMDINFRLRQLRRLRTAIQKHEKDILHALELDLGKREPEAYISEIGYVYHSIRTLLQHLRFWAGRQHCKTPYYLQPARSFIERIPYGTVLIIGPFNYPFQLVMEPLIGAIAAGNTIVVKPSELATHTEHVITALLQETFPAHYIHCVTGDQNVCSALLEEPFDYIFFTGSMRVGRIVQQQAARHLIPTTLELGGKCPVIVDDSANLKNAARQIIWGKLLNAGQTCVAPDYILVQENVKEKLITELKQAIYEQYGSPVSASPDFGRIINDKHVQRLSSMIELERAHIVSGGSTDPSDRYIEPTLFSIDTPDSPLMQEEIFGPLLPILAFHDLKEAITIAQRYPNPLALYLFTTRRHTAQHVLRQLPSGGCAVNNVLKHFVNTNLPFGGCGQSGIGSYHGRASFEAFSHKRSILVQPSGVDLPLFYPPCTRRYLKLIRKIFR